MKRLIISAVFLFAIAGASAADRITATLTVTNVAGVTNGQTLNVNGDVRTFTNQVFTPSTQVLTNNTHTGTKTNLLEQISLNPFTQIIAQDVGTNSFKLIGVSGLAMSVTPSVGWATVSYSTQVVASLRAVQVPLSGLADVASRTTIADQIAQGLEDYATFVVNEAAAFVQNLVGKTNAQTITGAKEFTSPAGAWHGSVTNSPAIGGAIQAISDGTWSNGTLISPKTTNLVNYGNAIRSPGTGASSEQFGTSANASGNNSLALGSLATASGDSSLAIGPTTTASATYAIALAGSSSATAERAFAIGYSSSASGENAGGLGYLSVADAANALAFGAFTTAHGPNSIALGVSSGTDPTHTNSVAIGYNSVTTAKNQIMLGSDTTDVVVKNTLTVSSSLTVAGGAAFGGAITNATFSGTNNFPAGSDVAYGRYSLGSLANGNNAGVVVGTNVFVEVSGPSGAFTVNGIAGGRDGKLVILVNQTGQDMTIAHQSGVDPTAGNRIVTMTGADRATTGNGAATLIYSGAASRWILISFDP